MSLRLSAFLLAATPISHAKAVLPLAVGGGPAGVSVLLEALGCWKASISFTKAPHTHHNRNPHPRHSSAPGRRRTPPPPEPHRSLFHSFSQPTCRVLFKPKENDCRRLAFFPAPVAAFGYFEFISFVGKEKERQEIHKVTASLMTFYELLDKNTF